jgi:hypothetical protein
MLGEEGGGGLIHACMSDMHVHVHVCACACMCDVPRGPTCCIVYSLLYILTIESCCITKARGFFLAWEHLNTR